MKNPETHLTRTAVGGWTVIYQGQPLLHEKATLADCFAVAARIQIKLPAQVWIGAQGRFGTLTEAKEAQP